MIQLEDFKWMFQYLRMLDPMNAKIIEGLGRHGPRNVLSLAKSLGLPPTTVAFRIKKLMKRGYLRVLAKSNSPKLGLMKAVLICDTKHGNENTLLKVIENIDYWTYIARCYGKYNGFCVVFSFPEKHKDQLEDYLKKSKELGVILDYLLFWTTNIYEITPNFSWFDFKKKAWIFPWQNWVREVLKASTKLPEYLADPKEYNVEVDKADLLILKELEKNGSATFTEMAKIAGITPQAVRHRFWQHIVRRGLIAGYDIAIFPYPLQLSDLCTFVLHFKNEAALAKFANSIQRKPFIVNHAKIIGLNSLIVHSYTPKIEFSNFMDALNRLTQEDIIQDFFHVTIDVASFKRQTVSYEYFENKKWIYSHIETINRLTKIVPARLEMQRSIQ